VLDVNVYFEELKELNVIVRVD